MRYMTPRVKSSNALMGSEGNQRLKLHVRGLVKKWIIII